MKILNFDYMIQNNDDSDISEEKAQELLDRFIDLCESMDLSAGGYQEIIESE